MLTLVYKDFLLQRGTKAFLYMLAMPVLSAFAFSSDLLYVILPYIAGSYLYIVYANALDDKYNSEKVFISMPIKRSTIVGAKYFGMFAYMLGFIAVIGLLSFIIRMIIPGFEDIPVLSWSQIVQLVTVGAMYYSILFPLYFKLGYQKSRWINYFAMIFSAGLYALATKGITSITGTDISSLQAALEFLTGIQIGIWNIFLPLFSAAAVAVSVRLSVIFFSRREF